MAIEFLPEIKVCCICKQHRPKNEFNLCLRNSDGLVSRCRKCESNKEWTTNRRNNMLQDRYGISEAEYELMLKSQKGVCALCGKSETRKENGIVSHLAVDHNHKTFKIRGLLCLQCNTMLGKIENFSEGVQTMVKYLKGENRG